MPTLTRLPGIEPFQPLLLDALVTACGDSFVQPELGSLSLSPAFFVEISTVRS